MNFYTSFDFVYRGDKLRIGICTPLNATVDLGTNHPNYFWSRAQFTEVNSLEELDRDDPDLDGKKIFYDHNTG